MQTIYTKIGLISGVFDLCAFQAQNLMPKIRHFAEI